MNRLVTACACRTCVDVRALDALMSGLCALHGHDADLPRLGVIEAVRGRTLSVRWEDGEAEVVADSGAVVARSQYGLGEDGWSVGDEVRRVRMANGGAL